MLVIESEAPGGQAGSSSKIENYLGFPTGISGQELAGRAYTQAQKFGAQIMIAKCAKRLAWWSQTLCDRIGRRTKHFHPRSRYRHWREVSQVVNRQRRAIRRRRHFTHGATFVESQLCRDDELIVIGGGNSAGQAAVFLAQTSKCVHMLVRSNGLAASMSRYLIRRIEENPAIDLRTCTEVVGLEGNDHLERGRWRDKRTGKIETRDIRHVFVMTGAIPNTGWLAGCVPGR